MWCQNVAEFTLQCQIPAPNLLQKGCTLVKGWGVGNAEWETRSGERGVGNAEWGTLNTTTIGANLASTWYGVMLQKQNGRLFGCGSSSWPIVWGSRMSITLITIRSSQRTGSRLFATRCIAQVGCTTTNNKGKQDGDVRCQNFAGFTLQC